MVPKKDSEIKRMSGSAPMKKSYLTLNADYKKIYEHEILFCPKCGEWKDAEGYFYRDTNYEIGRFPICKQCLLAMVEQRENGRSRECVETVLPVLQLLNKPFIESYYESCVKSVVEGMGKYQKSSAFVAYMTGMQSLPQYRNKTWKDTVYDISGNDSQESDDEPDSGINENSRLIKAAHKRFGYDYDLPDLQFLETQYEDWVSRYECQTKAQEEIFERLAFKKWEINKATKEGQPTAQLDKTYQDLLNTANITPKQTGMDAFADAQTLGTLIQKWEEEKPLPEIDPELQDVDKIGLYLDAFFRGHTSKMLGIKNAFSNIYEKVMSKYTVKPPSYEDDEDSEAVFNKIFGTQEDF